MKENFQAQKYETKPKNLEEIEDIDGAIEEAVINLQESVTEHNDLIAEIDFDSLEFEKYREIQTEYESMKKKLNSILAGSLITGVAGFVSGASTLNVVDVLTSTYTRESIEMGAKVTEVGLAAAVIIAAAAGIGHVLNKIRAVKKESGRVNDLSERPV